MCYLFFFLSFLLLLTELWAAPEVRGEAWPVVFRWSNNLFLVGNSLLQVTQWRISSFCGWKLGKKSIKNTRMEHFLRVKQFNKVLFDNWKGWKCQNWWCLTLNSANLTFFDLSFPPPFFPFGFPELRGQHTNQFGISGLPENWITPEELHGAILCFLSFKNRSPGTSDV